MVPAAPTIPADESVASLAAGMDARYAARARAGALPDAVALGVVALSMTPDNPAVEWRLARAYFAAATEQSNRVLRRALAAEAMAWAARARAHAPQRVEGHYYDAVATGEYALTIGIVRAVADGVAGRIEAAAAQALAADPDFLDGAPGVVVGRYWFSIPWPARDLDRSRAALAAVVARHPGKLIARVYLAETCWALDDEACARRELRAVLAAAPPPPEPGEEPLRTMARRAWREWFDEPPP